MKFLGVLLLSCLALSVRADIVSDIENNLQTTKQKVTAATVVGASGAYAFKGFKYYQIEKLFEAKERNIKTIGLDVDGKPIVLTKEAIAEMQGQLIEGDTVLIRHNLAPEMNKARHISILENDISSYKKLQKDLKDVYFKTGRSRTSVELDKVAEKILDAQKNISSLRKLPATGFAPFIEVTTLTVSTNQSLLSKELAEIAKRGDIIVTITKLPQHECAQLKAFERAGKVAGIVGLALNVLAIEEYLFGAGSGLIDNQERY